MLAGVIVVVTVVCYFGFAPVSHTSSFVLEETPTFLGYAANCTASWPDHAQVSGKWTTSNNASVEFAIVSSGPSSVYEGSGYSGNFSFPATSGSYRLLVVSPAPTTVIVYVTYTSSLL